MQASRQNIQNTFRKKTLNIWNLFFGKRKCLNFLELDETYTTDTYGNGCADSDDDEPHGVGVDADQTSGAGDERHHTETQHGDPEHAHEETH